MTTDLSARLREDADEMERHLGWWWSPICKRIRDAATHLDSEPDRIQQAVEREREANCKAICNDCRADVPLENGKHILRGRGPSTENDILYGAPPCKAATIRARPIPPPSQWVPTHRHVSRKLYQVIARGMDCTNASPEPHQVVIYRDEIGRWWVRDAHEFDDGRFAPL